MPIENLTELTDQLTRKEKRRRNPVSWVILIIFAILLLIFFVFPKLGNYFDLKNKVLSLDASVLVLEEERPSLQSRNDELKIQFDDESKPFLVREEQIFPKVIDISKIAKILEIFSLQLDLLSSDAINSYFELDKVSFGKRTKMQNRPYTYTEVNISILTDKENLKEFIIFLQTGNLSNRFEQAKNSRILNSKDHQFLKDNLLPLVNIESINIIEDNKSKSEGGLKVNLKVRFFSQVVS